MTEPPSAVIYHIVSDVGAMTMRPNEKQPYLWYAYIFQQSIGMALIYTLSAVFMIVEPVPWTGKIEAIHFVFAITHIQTKHYNIMIRRNVLYKMVERLDNLWRTGKEAGILKEDYQDTEKKIRLWCIASYILFESPTYSGIILAVLLNVGKPREEWGLFYTPYNTSFWSSWIYIGFIINLWTFYTCLISASSSANLLYALTKHIALQLKILQTYAKSYNGGSGHNKKFFKLHQDILKLTRDLNDLLSGQYILEFFCNTVELAARIIFIFITVDSEGFSTPLIPSLCLLFAASTTPLMICYCGNILTSESENLHKALYDNQWYKENAAIRRDILQMTVATTVPLNLQYKHFLIFGMEQFTSFWHGVVSYSMAMRFFLTNAKT